MASVTSPPAPGDYREYLVARARLHLAARPWLRARLDASDVVQDVLGKAHAALPTFRGQSPDEFVAWLQQILNRTLANVLRAHAQASRDVGAERSLEADLDASSRRLDAWLAVDHTSPSARATNHERAAALATAVDALPADQRAIVLLKHCQGLTLAEIAMQTDRTPAAVAGLLRRGLAQLRHVLGEGDFR